MPIYACADCGDDLIDGETFRCAPCIRQQLMEDEQDDGPWGDICEPKPITTTIRQRNITAWGD